MQAQLFSATPITDLGTGLYLNQYQGGLYENGTNVLPSDHLADGQALDPQIADGTPFVFLGIGMSDVENAFSTFLNTVEMTQNVNPNMTLVVGGQARTPANGPTRKELPHRMAARSLQTLC